MKAIFDAIRAAKDLRKSDEGYHLQAFELRNRGHQNQLDDLALELMTKPFYHFTPWGAFRTRVDTLQDSLRALLQGLTAFVPAHATHRADWQSILSATDSTGLMLRTTRGLIQDWATYGAYREFGTLRVERYASELKDGVLKLNLSLCAGPRDALKAQRQLSIAAPETGTLQGCLQLYAGAVAGISALLKSASTWPEFSAESAKAQREADLRSRLRTTLAQSFSNEELAWLRSNAASLQF